MSRETSRLPRSWTEDPERCQAAGIPCQVKFATKPQLARRMIKRAVTAKVPFTWIAADEVYRCNGPRIPPRGGSGGNDLKDLGSSPCASAGMSEVLATVFL